MHKEADVQLEYYVVLCSVMLRLLLNVVGSFSARMILKLLLSVN